MLPKLRAGRRPARLGSVALLVGALMVMSSGPVVAVITHVSAGWGTTASWKGVDGYIRQSTTTTLSGTQAHVNYINICGTNCDSWVQTGTAQGNTPLGPATYSTVQIFYENWDACDDYWFSLVGAPPTPNYPFYLSWDGGSSYNQSCNDGRHQTAYVWEWRKGSFTNAPFHYGNLGFSSGQASAATEVLDSATIGTDRFGCDHNKVCSSAAYGIHVYDGSTWSLLTAGGSIGPGNPPYRHTYQNYWAFATCPVSC